MRHVIWVLFNLGLIDKTIWFTSKKEAEDFKLSSRTYYPKAWIFDKLEDCDQWDGPWKFSKDKVARCESSWVLFDKDPVKRYCYTFSTKKDALKRLKAQNSDPCNTQLVGPFRYFEKDCGPVLFWEYI